MLPEGAAGTPRTGRLGALVLSVMIVSSCGLVTSAVPSHHRPYQWYPYLTGTGRLSDKGPSRRAERGMREGHPEKATEGETLIVDIPTTLLEYCTQYAAAKNMSVAALVRMILTQGIAATADAEGYL